MIHGDSVPCIASGRPGSTFTILIPNQIMHDYFDHLGCLGSCESPRVAEKTPSFICVNLAAANGVWVTEIGQRILQWHSPSAHAIMITRDFACSIVTQLGCRLRKCLSPRKLVPSAHRLLPGGAMCRIVMIIHHQRNKEQSSIKPVRPLCARRQID